MKVDISEINKKKKKLEQIKKELKKEFIGIDYIIDELIDYIQIWYLMPEVLSRPIIVNLWGMTGVGKTDLIRKLVSKLNYQDRFTEVELSNGDSGGNWRSSVSSLLDSNNITDGLPAIVLFDEIQRFNTIDTDGNPIQNAKFQDFWELLSDGRLAKREVKEDIDSYVNNYFYSSAQRKKRNKENPDDTTDPNQIGIWEAARIKKLFGIEGDIQEIALMDEEDLLNVMQKLKAKKKIYEAIDHSKTLIIISGNLDEAFTMAGSTAEADIDADIFHAYTEKITLMDIKNALSRKFRPEQVARFGNIHLIYKSLKRKDFIKLIKQETDKIVVKNKKHFDITLQISDNIRTLIYQNGVFPVQGVRPVFSSVIDILETNLAKFLFEAFMRNVSDIKVDYDFKKSEITALLKGTESIIVPYVGRVDRIRQSNHEDAVANVSVHEAGHAVAYGVLFGLAVLQLKSKVASTYVGGFAFPHQIYQTKENTISQIIVFLAGGLAEELIFGEGNATIGRENDRLQASSLAMGYIRKYGFHDDFQAYYSNDVHLPMDVTVTDKTVEKMIDKLVKSTKKLLEKHKELLFDLSKELQKEGLLKPEKMKEIAAQHDQNWEIKEESYLHLHHYGKELL